MLSTIYLDNNATTQPDQRVLDVALPFLREVYGNAHSSHRMGQIAHQAIVKAREQVADLLQCAPQEILFTSGATESLNLAIKGIAELATDKRNRCITIQTEHHATLDVFRALEDRGFPVSYVPVMPDGSMDWDAFNALIDDSTLLVSVMLANNETGVIHPMATIAERVHAAGAYLISDATQAVGKIPVAVEKLGVDALAFSGHKFHAPKGTGGLFLKKGISIQPQLHGGGQEQGIRSGTLNTFGIVALGAACKIAMDTLSTDMLAIASLRDTLEQALLRGVSSVEVNGTTAQRLPNTTNLLFRGIDSDILQRAVQHIMLSNGSACSSAKIEPSHVLRAMGRSEAEAFQSIRFSLSRYTTAAEIDATIRAVADAVARIRAHQE